MNPEISKIISAIEYEADLGSKPLDWTIHGREKHGKLWKVFVAPSHHNGQLDDSLEGAAAWWPGPPKGSADVLSVVPEELQINLRCATADVPQLGKLKIYPIRFLDKLAEAWSSPFRGPRFYNAYEELEANSAQKSFSSLNPKLFEELRPAQRQAFSLLDFRFSFLWGPPGTGKTHTLGALLATFLVENPTARVLLVSTTNTAVDLALVSVDQALERISKTVPGAALCRHKCKRIGAHFVAQHYKEREHLIPSTNEVLIQQLAALEVSRPDAADVVAYDAWKSKVEVLRNLMRAQARHILLSSRLAALTCTRGVFSLSDLEEIGSFDLVVFDEASQVGLAHALPFLPLASRVLFAGDPKQLEPIVVAEDKEVKEWLGRSPFAFMRQDQSNTTILTEQSRMTADICRVVGETFYDGKLTVCPKAISSLAWKADRSLKNLPKLGIKPLSCIAVSSEGGFHPGLKGFMREESANHVVSAVQAAITEAQPADIAVLTPYRAQRTVIKKKLKNAGISGVQVSTVHRAQGSEKRTIFFDPVLGTHQALTDRLINVALSRAKARLVVALSQGDIGNPRLAQVRALMSCDVATNAIPLGDVLQSGKPLKSWEGTKVSYKDKHYIFEGVDESGENILLRDCVTGLSKKFKKSMLLVMTGAKVKDAPKLVVPQIKTPPIAKINPGGPVSLVEFLHSKPAAQTAGSAKVTHKGKLYVFMGFDPSKEKVLLRECSGGPIKPFKLDVVLAQPLGQ